MLFAEQKGWSLPDPNKYTPFACGKEDGPLTQC